MILLTKKDIVQMTLAVNQLSADLIYLVRRGM